MTMPHQRMRSFSVRAFPPGGTPLSVVWADAVGMEGSFPGSGHEWVITGRFPGAARPLRLTLALHQRRIGSLFLLSRSSPPDFAGSPPPPP